MNDVGICCAVRVSDTEAWLGLSSGEIQSFNLQTWKLGTAWRAHKRRVLALAVHEQLVWSSADEAIIWEIRVRGRGEKKTTLKYFPFVLLASTTTQGNLQLKVVRAALRRHFHAWIQQC